MRSYGIVLAGLVLLGAASASAQESWCFSATANQVTKMTKAIDRQNASVCTRLTLAYPCTQSAACTAAGLPSSCTPAQARNANIRIYDGTTQPGREEYASELMRIGFQNVDNGIVAFDQTAWCSKFRAATQPQKDSSCTAVGYVAGCEPCP